MGKIKKFEDEDEIAECYSLFFEQLFSSEMDHVLDLIKPFVSTGMMSTCLLPLFTGRRWS